MPRPVMNILQTISLPERMPAALSTKLRMLRQSVSEDGPGDERDEVTVGQHARHQAGDEDEKKCRAFLGHIAHEQHQGRCFEGEDDTENWKREHVKDVFKTVA